MHEVVPMNYSEERDIWAALEILSKAQGDAFVALLAAAKRMIEHHEDYTSGEFADAAAAYALVVSAKNRLSDYRHKRFMESLGR